MKIRDYLAGIDPALCGTEHFWYAYDGKPCCPVGHANARDGGKYLQPVDIPVSIEVLSAFYRTWDLWRGALGRPPAEAFEAALTDAELEEACQ